MINMETEIEGYIATLDKSPTRHVNRKKYASVRLETLIEQEIKRAYEQPLKLEILAQYYWDDAIVSFTLGFNWRHNVYVQAYKRSVSLEGELFADMTPIFLDGPGLLPYAERDKDGKAFLSY